MNKRTYTKKEKGHLEALEIVDTIIKTILKEGYGKCKDKNYIESCVACRRWRVWKEFVQAIKDDI